MLPEGCGVGGIFYFVTLFILKTAVNGRKKHFCLVLPGCYPSP